MNQTQAYAVAHAVAHRIYGDLLTQGWTLEACPDTGEVAVFVPGQCGDDGHAAHGLLTPTQASDTGDNDHGPGPCAELPWCVRVWYADGEGNQLWVSDTTYYALPY